MNTVATSDYTVVSAASAAALIPLVNAKILEGYTALGGIVVDTGTFYQTMARGDSGSFVATYAVTAVTTGVAGAASFTIAGDQTANFRAGHKFAVTGSTGNNGTYTVMNGSATYVGGNTVIPVNQAVTDATADGTVLGYAP